ncbi:unnamed protein product [Periconia digitata]|uniref:Uncharacterized protein n=1 Tax=Periconia digitata TaxID=1303443 RepID=A0A9W4UVS4_9PLEO|nr:unnamed protein product [Periconia digitata]
MPISASAIVQRSGNVRTGEITMIFSGISTKAIIFVIATWRSTTNIGRISTERDGCWRVKKPAIAQWLGHWNKRSFIRAIATFSALLSRNGNNSARFLISIYPKICRLDMSAAPVAAPIASLMSVYQSCSGERKGRRTVTQLLLSYILLRRINRVGRISATCTGNQQQRALVFAMPTLRTGLVPIGLTCRHPCQSKCGNSARTADMQSTYLYCVLPPRLTSRAHMRQSDGLSEQPLPRSC